MWFIYQLQQAELSLIKCFESVDKERCARLYVCVNTQLQPEEYQCPGYWEKSIFIIIFYTMKKTVVYTSVLSRQGWRSAKQARRNFTKSTSQYYTLWYCLRSQTTAPHACKRLGVVLAVKKQKRIRTVEKSKIPKMSHTHYRSHV